jgi:O-antigen ligase
MYTADTTTMSAALRSELSRATLERFRPLQSAVQAAKARDVVTASQRTIWAAVLSIASILIVFSLDEQSAAIWTTVVTVVWSVYNPYVFCLLFMPVLIPFGNAQMITGIDFTVLRAATIAAMCGCLVRPGPLKKGLAALPRYVTVSFALLSIAYIASAIANHMPAESPTKLAVHFTRVAQVAIAFVSVHQLLDGMPLIVGMMIAGASNLMAGLWVWWNTGDMIAARTSDLPLGTLEGTAEMIAKSGAFAVAAGVAAFALAERKHRTGSRVFLWVVGAAFWFSALFSGRREVLISIGMATMVVLLTGRLRHRVLLAAFVAAATIAVYQAGPLEEFLTQREAISDEFVDGRGTGRLPLFWKSVEIFAESPIFGTGPGTHTNVMWSKSDFSEGGIAAHNSITGNLVEAGIAGGVAVLIMLYGFFAAWSRATAAARRTPRREWPPTMLASMATIAASALVWDFVNHSGYMLMFGMLAAWWVKMRTAPYQASAETREMAISVAGRLRRRMKP